MLVDDVVGPPSKLLGIQRGPVGAWNLQRLRHGWVYTARVRRPVQRRGGQVGSEAERVEHCRLCAPEKGQNSLEDFLEQKQKYRAKLAGKHYYRLPGPVVLLHTRAPLPLRTDSRWQRPTRCVLGGWEEHPGAAWGGGGSVP